MVGEHVNNVRHADFKNNVHTTLQVQTQTNLSLQTLLIRIDAEILHGVLVVLSCDRVAQFGRLLVIVACSR